MGLDISFDRQAALDAGLALTLATIGSADDIRRERRFPGSDPGYLAWLTSVAEGIVVPGTDLCVVNDGCGEFIQVRASHWGRVHAPLTAWLRAHGIAWDEH